MSSLIDKYITKRGLVGPWGISSMPLNFFQDIVIIPAYAELEYIGHTLDSLSECEVDSFDSILVVVVVNNETDAHSKILNNNQKTLSNLKKRNDLFSLVVIDASSDGMSIPKKHAGVGMARRIGMDFALRFAYPHSLLFCLDADSLVAPTYFREIQSHFNGTDSVAAVVEFSHSNNKNLHLETAIRQYEAFLRSTAKNLTEAGSPFGYVSMGSTIICKSDAYASIGGMPRRKATEDFYFLQEFAKFKRVDKINSTLVYPSSRESERVYLGTGFRMSQANKGKKLGDLYYPIEAFSVLKGWLLIAMGGYKEDIDEILMKTRKLSSILYDYLMEENIKKIWDPLRESSPTDIHFQKQFHRWFDALKTHRLLNRYLIISSML